MSETEWNRQSRKSGGYRRDEIFFGQKEGPVLSIQCFESRHADCFGDCKPFAPGQCECSCHGIAEKLGNGK